MASYGKRQNIGKAKALSNKVPTCGFGEQVQGLHPVAVIVPSSLVKSKILSRTITRAVLSDNQEVNWAFEVGVAAGALPPPVVPVARPKGVPTADAMLNSAEAMRSKLVSEASRTPMIEECAV